MTAPEDGTSVTVTISDDQAGLRLDRALAQLLPEISRARLQKLMAEGVVALNGTAAADPARKVRAGETVTLAIPAAKPATPEAQAIPLTVVHEDTDLIVVDKPPGLVVHPAPGNWDRTLVNALLAHCGDSLRGIGGVGRPGIVHRLDKDTSGLMVAAKTGRAMASLGRQFAAHVIDRRYRAVVFGSPRFGQGTVDAPIGRSPQNRQKMAVVAAGRPARTHWSVVARYGAAATMVECRLETGRTHQVRVHMAEIGHPLVGDPLYAGGRRIKGLAEPLARQALHAAILGFQHPSTHRPMRFESPIPGDIRALVQNLETMISGLTLP